MAGWRQEWWAIALRDARNGAICPADACEAALEYIDGLQSGEPEAMSFDAWCDRMAVRPSLSIVDVEELLDLDDATENDDLLLWACLTWWLAEAKAKETA
jgi:hypothetical protein